MKIRQLSIFLENRAGRLAGVTKILGDAGIDILAISVADTTDFGILRILVDDGEKAVEALKAQEIVCRLTDVSVVSVEGVPGGLAKVLETINASGVNIEYMYAVSQKKLPNPLMVFRFSDESKARAALENAGVKLIDEEELI